MKGLISFLAQIEVISTHDLKMTSQGGLKVSTKIGCFFIEKRSKYQILPYLGFIVVGKGLTFLQKGVSQDII